MLKYGASIFSHQDGILNDRRACTSLIIPIVTGKFIGVQSKGHTFKYDNTAMMPLLRRGEHIFAGSEALFIWVRFYTRDQWPWLESQGFQGPDFAKG